MRDSTSPFKTSLLESSSRVDRALKAAIAEMYLQGVSTRWVTKVVEGLCGTQISSAQVSRLTSELDGEFEKWRNRQLEPVASLILDATYVKVRMDGAVRDCAILTAIGVRCGPPSTPRPGSAASSTSSRMPRLTCRALNTAPKLPPTPPLGLQHARPRTCPAQA